MTSAGLLLQGGTVFDGLGAPGRVAEVAATLWSGLAGGAPIGPAGFGELAGRLDRAGPANNLALLVGHGTLRLTANGLEERLGPGAATRMAALAAEAFAAGAVGLSSGLIYVPGSYADTGELVALARVAAAHGGVYATHMRDEGAHLVAALDEAVAIARAAGARLQVSHCKAAGRAAHGSAGRLLERLAAARLEGVDAQGDQYPYDAGATVLSALLPPAVAAGGTEAMRARLRDPAARAALRTKAEGAEVGNGSWAETDPDGVLLTGHRDGRLVGRTLAEAAGDRDPWDA